MKKLSLMSVPVLLPVLAFVGMGLSNVSAQAITYPTKNIEVVIPKNPGGGTDTSARTLIEYSKNNLPKGILFVPVNKPAGNGITGLIEVAKAKADGYKLVVVTVEIAMFPHQNKSPVSYKDFTALVATIADPVVIVVNANSPYKTMQEFIDGAKKAPKQIKVGNSGVGAIYHLAAINIEQKTGVKFNHIPYNEGTGPSIAALVGGHIDAVLTTPGSVKAQVDAGLLTILGVMDDKRFELVPNVPTLKEALGLDTNVKMRAWALLAGPANMPKNITDELVAAFNEIVQNPAYQDAMRKQGIMPIVMTGEAVAKIMQEDDEMYKALIEESKKN